MQKSLSRKINVSLVVLAVFGFFYFFREMAFREYISSAEQAGSESAALEEYIYADALGEKSRSAELSISRVEILFSRKDYAAAEEELTQALGSDDGNATLYGWLGKVKCAEGDYAGAEKYYARAFEIEPTAPLSIERAKSLVRGGKFGEAQQILEEARQKIAGSDVDYYFFLVQANNGQFSADDFDAIKDGKYASKISVVEVFFAREDDSVKASSDYGLVSRADLFRRIGEEDFTLANLDIVLSRNGKYPDAYLVLGKTLAATGDYDRARESFERCLALDVDNTEAIFYLGKIYEASGDSEKAREYGVRYESLTG